VRPLAFNATDKLVLLHNLDCGMPLAVYRGDSPEGPYGEDIGGFENIWHFDFVENRGKPPEPT
jgi:hypothetical protein